jgi:hypothetical protein
MTSSACLNCSVTWHALAGKLSAQTSPALAKFLRRGSMTKTTVEIADRLNVLAGDVQLLGLAVEGLLADQESPEAALICSRAYDIAGEIKAVSRDVHTSPCK